MRWRDLHCGDVRPDHAGTRVALAGWVATLIYVWLVGAQPPAVRTVLAMTLWMLLRLRGVHCSSWQVWLWCIGLILLCDPLAVLSDSFWLSVLAVGCLIFWFEWAPLGERFRSAWYWAPVRWLHIQLGMTLLLVPMQAALFLGLTLTSLPANLWAVPIVSLVTVPLNWTRAPSNSPESERRRRSSCSKYPSASGRNEQFLPMTS